jgi:sugar/nucleoside kinase (ribokinase family)
MFGAMNNSQAKTRSVRVSKLKMPAVHQETNNQTEDAPISVGAGLIAWDWLLIGDDRVRPNETYAGGSCGNVMAILAYLGWRSYPVARLARDHRSARLIEDLRRWNVQTNFVFRRQKGATPVIIVRLREATKGIVTRHYEWRHPSTGEWLPRYRPLPKKIAEPLFNQLPAANVFYFDRAEPSSLLFAVFMRARGAVVVFEPSSASKEELFSSCLEVSDIVKYSVERLPQPPQNPVSKSPRLEIQTLGATGLRYRLKQDATTPGPWRHLPAYPVKTVRDATGSGDWCSAGLISKVCHAGRQHFLSLDERAIVDALQFGQALGALNCGFVGARGPMYKLTAHRMLNDCTNLQNSNPRQNGKNGVGSGRTTGFLSPPRSQARDS